MSAWKWATIDGLLCGTLFAILYVAYRELGGPPIF